MPTKRSRVERDPLKKLFNKIDRLSAEQLQAKGRKPAGEYSFVGHPPILTRHIEEIAKAARLQVPPEDRWSELARGLSGTFVVALAQRDDRDDAASIARSGVFREIAATGRKFLSLLHAEIENLPSGAEPGAVLVERSGIILEFARHLPCDTITGALFGVKSIVMAAEHVKIARGRRPNSFAARLLEELALQFREMFGSWPVLKNRQRERDPNSPGALWLRKVCDCAMPARPRGVLKLSPRLEPLTTELMRIKQWKSDTLVGEFEKAITRARRR